MGLITNIKLGFRFKNLYLIVKAIRKIVNWPSYFLDLFSLSKGKFTFFYMRDSLKYLVRSRTCDRGIITTVHLADQYRINDLLLSDNSVVIDIGAHIGIFTVYISKKAAKIFSYEPVIENYKILEQNIKLNNLEYKTKIFNCAVSDNNKKIKIYFSETNTGAHSAYMNTKNYIEAPAVTLEELIDINNINRCDLLKIDAEGSEYDILFSLPKHYFEKIDRIYLEYHDTNLKNRRDSYDFLKEFLIDKGFIVTQKKPILFAERN